MRKMKFVSKEKGALKTTLSDNIMNQIGDIVEKKLESKGVLYVRNGAEFNVESDNISTLIDAQGEATRELIKAGIITRDMIEKDLEYNNIKIK